MRYKLSIPARINILGNPSDGNEGDFATITAAVNLYASALFEPADKLVIESIPPPNPIPGEEFTPERLEFSQLDFPFAYDGNLDLLKGAINRLYRFSDEFRQKFDGRVHISTWTEVPRQSGLGGSSLFVLLVLAGLREFYHLDPLIHNNYVLAELTQRVEGKELGIACGFADRYVPLFGGLAYLDYRGKLLHEEISHEPFATYERLDPWAPNLPLVAITTGIQHDSGDIHGRMRPRYLEEHADWVKKGGEIPPMVRLMTGAWETAWRGKIALLSGDYVAFGALMNENHRLVDEMMTYCGFEDGAGWANNLCIQTSLENGALGAKLTGAGGGGSVFALTLPGEEVKLVRLWERLAQDENLSSARIYIPQIVPTGLMIENI